MSRMRSLILLTMLLCMSLISAGCQKPQEPTTSKELEDLTEEFNVMMASTLQERALQRSEELRESDCAAPGRNIANEDLDKVGIMSQEEVCAILGNSFISISVPGEEFDVIYRFYQYTGNTDDKETDCSNTPHREVLVPIVFVDDTVVGVGWGFFGEYIRQRPNLWQESWDDWLERIGRMLLHANQETK